MEAANVWIDEGLVFTTETGGKVDPRNFLRVIEKAAATAKVSAPATNHGHHGLIPLLSHAQLPHKGSVKDQPKPL